MFSALRPRRDFLPDAFFHQAGALSFGVSKFGSTRYSLRPYFCWGLYITESSRGKASASLISGFGSPPFMPLPSPNALMWRFELPRYFVWKCFAEVSGPLWRTAGKVLVESLPLPPPFQSLSKFPAFGLQPLFAPEASMDPPRQKN